MTARTKTITFYFPIGTMLYFGAFGFYLNGHTDGVDNIPRILFLPLIPGFICTFLLSQGIHSSIASWFSIIANIPIYWISFYFVMKMFFSEKEKPENSEPQKK